MNSESESPLGDADIDSEDPNSQSGTAEAALVGESRPDRAAAIDRVASRLVVHWRSILLTASVIAAVGLAGCLYVLLYRPDRQIDDAAAQRAIRAASDGAVAALSYSSENMDRDFARARSHLTGDFLAYYDKFTKEIVIPTVQQKHLGQTASVVESGRVRTGAELSRRAGVPQRDHDRQGQAATVDNSERRANYAHEGQRFMVDLEIGSGGISAASSRSNPYQVERCRCYSRQARTPLPVPVTGSDMVGLSASRSRRCDHLGPSPQQCCWLPVQLAL